MLMNWQSPLHMRAGLPNSVLHEAEIFYDQYIEAVYGPPKEESPDDDVPWDAEGFVGEMT